MAIKKDDKEWRKIKYTSQTVNNLMKNHQKLIYYGSSIKKKRQYNQVLNTNVSLYQSSQHFDFDTDKFFNVGQIQFSARKQNKIYSSINNQFQAYIHNTFQQRHADFRESINLTGLNNIKKAAEKAKEKFAELLKSQIQMTPQTANHLGQVLNSNDIDTDLILNNIDLIDKGIQEAIYNSINLVGIQNAQKAYASSFGKKFNNKTAIETVISSPRNDNGDLTGLGLQAFQSLLDELMLIYSYINNVTLPQILFIERALKQYGANPQKLGEYLINQSFVLKTDTAKSAAKKVGTFLQQLKYYAKPEDIKKAIKGSIRNAKYNIISTQFAEHLQDNINRFDNNINQTINNYLEFKEHFGSSRVKNISYKRKTNTPVTDVKTIVHLKNVLLQSKVSNKDGYIQDLQYDLTFDTGLSVKFYQGLSKKKNSNTDINSALKIHLGSGGTIKEFIETNFPNETDNNRYYLYNRIAYEGFKPNSSLSKFFLITHFTRLFMTGEYHLQSQKEDLASYLIVNGVPISIWGILNEALNQKLINDFIELSFLYKGNERKAIKYDNDRIERNGIKNQNARSDYFAALRRSHMIYENINSTTVKVHLHLDKIINSFSPSQKAALSYK